MREKGAKKPTATSATSAATPASPAARKESDAGPTLPTAAITTTSTATTTTTVTAEVAVDAVPKSTQHTWVAEVRVGSSKYKISVVDTAAAAVATAAKFDKGTHTQALSLLLCSTLLCSHIPC
jgi:hypothetical protein